MTTTVSIGRDCAGNELEEPQWAAFCDAIVAALEDVGLIVVFAGTGTGYWQPAPGEPVVTEESFTAVAVGTPISLLRPLLADLADRFGQEAIALTTGETDLVEAAPLFAVVGGVR